VGHNSALFTAPSLLSALQSYSLPVEESSFLSSASLLLIASSGSAERFSFSEDAGATS